MLSIGKLAVGQAGYYLEQAHGSVTRAGAVRSGVEDYYLGGPEAVGVWTGDGARALGLGGEVDAVRLDRVLAGEHPASGDLLGRVVAGRVPGFDLTFSAPKSVSVLFGIGDDALRGAIRDAHDEAVADALGYLERHAAMTRRGRGGAHVIPGRGLVGRLSDIARRAPAIRSFIPTCTSPTSCLGRMADGRRSMGAGSTRTPRPPG